HLIENRPTRTISHMEPSFANSLPTDSQRRPVGVTAIVPARNEDEVIATCIHALARQPEVVRIVVINDQSTDRTSEVVRGLLPERSNFRLSESENVPPNWVGKNNAVWLGSRQAASEWLLFTDADAELSEGAVSRALEIAEENRAELMSFSPEQVTKTWYERAL